MKRSIIFILSISPLDNINVIIVIYENGSSEFKALKVVTMNDL